MATPMQTLGFLDAGTPTDPPAEISTEVLERLRDATEYYATGIGDGITWDAECMTMWAYRVAKLLKFMSTLIVERTTTTDDHTQRVEAIASTAASDIIASEHRLRMA